MTANLVCPRCDGWGVVPTNERGRPGYNPECPTCGGRGYLDPPAGHVTFSEIATTPEGRARIRGQTRFRRGYALSPRGQRNITNKQRRRNAGD